MKWREDVFRTNFTRLLDARGFSQRKLADALGKHETAVSKWTKKGGNIPGLQTIFEIAEVLGVRPSVVACATEYEPMDDEELDLVIDWRKFDRVERRAFARLLKQMSKGRERLKNESVHRKRATPLIPRDESHRPPLERKELEICMKGISSLLAGKRLATAESADYTAVTRRLAELIEIQKSAESLDNPDTLRDAG